MKCLYEISCMPPPAAHRRVLPRRLSCILSRKLLALPLLLGCLIPALPDAYAAGDGEKMYNDLREKNGLYQDEDWQDYVTGIGERLLAASGLAGGNYTFTVVDNSAVNAAATQDGYIFVNRGLIAFCRSEDELAGVIGHEIGHVVGRHVQRSKGLNRLGGLLGWLGVIGTSSFAMKDLGDTLTATAVSREAREYELEADGYGAGFLARAGYDPLAMIEVIHVLKDQELFAKSVMNRPSVYHGILGTHPRNDKRLNDVVYQAVPLAGMTSRPPERDFWQMVDGLVYGDEAATGLVKDGVFYHGSLRIVVAFPEGWGVTNTASAVSGRDVSGTSSGSIGVQRQNPPAEEQTPEEYIRETLKRDDIENGEVLVVNGYEAYVTDVQILGGDDQVRKMAIVYKDGGIYLIKGTLGAVGDPAQFEQDFRETLGSFRAMTAADLKVANNQRIMVVMANPGDTYAELARKVSIKRYPEETLRILNGHHPRGEPRAGDYIKVVQ